MNKADWFLQDCLNEPSYVTVECSAEKPLSEEMKQAYNHLLEPHGHYIECYPCDTCAEYSKGKRPYHIERHELQYRELVEQNKDENQSAAICTTFLED